MDFHFLIRNGIVGFIALIFFLAGVSLVDWELAIKIAQGAKDFTALLNFAAAFLVGIVIQGTLILWQERAKRQRIFADEARHVIADKVRNVLKGDNDLRFELQNSMLHLKREKAVRKGYNAIKDLLDQKSRPDPIFVAIYHMKAPSYLIEWARRRRSYYYLGTTSIIAVISGLVLGFIFGVALRYWHSEDLLSENSLVIQWERAWAGYPLRWLFLVTGLLLLIFLIKSTLWLANRMKEDADEMELTWALTERSDVARKKLGLKDER